MKFTINDMANLMSAQIFNQVISCGEIKMHQYNAVVKLLVKNCIPFDSSYTPGNQRDEPMLVLTIYIGPQMTLNLNFTCGEISDE